MEIPQSERRTSAFPPKTRAERILILTNPFERAAVETVRKRNSNKRLFEYKAEAVRP